jgi:hypothetical protein
VLQQCILMLRMHCRVMNQMHWMVQSSSITMALARGALEEQFVLSMGGTGGGVGLGKPSGNFKLKQGSLAIRAPSRMGSVLGEHPSQPTRHDPQRFKFRRATALTSPGCSESHAQGRAPAALPAALPACLPLLQRCSARLPVETTLQL